MCFEICDYIKVYKDNKLNRDVIELEITGESSIKDIFVSPSLVTELIVEIKDKEGSLVMIKEVNSL